MGWMDQDSTWHGGLSPVKFVLDGGPALPLQKGAEHPSPIFGLFLLWPNGWMDQDATWNAGKPRPRPHCVTWGPQLPRKRGTAPNFRFMSTTAKRSPISATAEHLFF